MLQANLLARSAQTFRQLSARATENSFVKSDRRLHHFIGPLIRLNPLKSSAWLNKHVPPVPTGLKNPVVMLARAELDASFKR